MPESPVEQLWREYGQAFRDYDDLTLARWMSQTLGQLRGRVWRLSHPLLGAYRLVAELAHSRQVWLKRLANAPADYPDSSCCRAPVLPLFTRDIIENGLICQHCGETVTPFDELPAELAPGIREWAEEYAKVHAVAHWDDAQRKKAGNFDAAFEDAAKEAERLLLALSAEILPKMLDHFPAIVWEDQDECLEVRPEDIR